MNGKTLSLAEVVDYRESLVTETYFWAASHSSYSWRPSSLKG